jgi:hypothetical protein
MRRPEVVLHEARAQLPVVRVVARRRKGDPGDRPRGVDGEAQGDLAPVQVLGTGSGGRIITSGVAG